MNTKILIQLRGLIDQIKEYAKANCDNNFTAAVRQLIQKGLKK